MTVTVCMGTYNGEKYIVEQLESILHQSKPADEVIICDDCSSDNTVALISQFIRDNGLQEHWRLYLNHQNKGYPVNFYDAMEYAVGDIVFLADQDDIWDNDKIEKMCCALDDNPKMQVCGCKFGLIDEYGNPIRTPLTPTHSTETGQLREVTMEEVLYKCQWPGMVLAYRREWYQRSVSSLLKDRRETVYDIPHDFLICVAAAEESGFGQLDLKLACHRRHALNAGKEEHHVGKLLDKSRKVMEIEAYIRMLLHVEDALVLHTSKGQDALRGKLSSMQGRLNALQSGKIGRVIRNAWMNRKVVRFATVICDLWIVKQ